MKEDQERLVTALSGSHRAKIIETHISWVLLAGRHAYKIKKAVRLGFLDFSSLASRLFYCREEIRLNRRLAKSIYLDVVPIGGTPDAPVIGFYPAIEYAVRMKRFPIEYTLDRLVKKGGLLPHHLDLLAESIASFHQGLPPADPDSGYGKDIIGPIKRSLDEIMRFSATDLSSILQAVSAKHAELENFFSARLNEGHVRECHGDLHLGNIVLCRGQPIPFDCIEFDPALRWIDVINEIAFTVMDLIYHERRDLAFRFLNAYLERTGDYPGLKALPFYIAARAIVRAMVEAIRSGRTPSCESHLALAWKWLNPARPFLIITHGLPGSGKTTFSQAALEKYGAIRIRSDVERKRMAGLSPLQESGSGIDSGLYAPGISKAVYARLLFLAQALLDAGFPVIVDAAFLEKEARDPFCDLARQLEIPFAVASMQAEESALVERIRTRRRDASEADLAVLKAKEAAFEPLHVDERLQAAFFSDLRDPEGWRTLEKCLVSA